MNIQEMPEEVIWASFITLNPIGLDTYIKVKEIMKKYPEYFPYETLYDSIPEEVHKAYQDHMERIWERRIRKFEKKPTYPYPYSSGSPLTINSLWETVYQMEESYEREERRKRLRKRADRRIWNKYYKPYKLKYRE